MRRFAGVLALALALPAAPCVAADAAANGKDADIAAAAETEKVMRDYLRAARADASPLSRLALAGTVAYLGEWGFISKAIPEAEWRPIRDGAVRDGRDDPMLQAVFLTGSAPATTDSSLRAHAIDLLTQRLDQNGQFGLVLLAQPEVASDAQAGHRVLHQMARATAFHSPYTAVQHALSRDLSGMRWTREPAPSPGQVEVPDEIQSGIVASALASFGAIPQMGAASRACESATGEVREDCRLLGRRLFAEAETVIDAYVALQLLDATAPDEAAHRQVANERRRVEWQSEQLATLWATGKTDTPDIRGHLERQGKLTELAAMRETLLALNLPLDPPADWRSRAERKSAPASDAPPPG